MSKSYYAANKALAHRYGGPVYVRPAIVYLGLLLQDPLPDASALLEPSSGSYARVARTNNNTVFPAPANGRMAVLGDVDFGTPTGPWGEINYFAFFDALSGGNMLDYAPVLDPATGQPAAMQINSGDTVIFYEGSLLFTEE